MKGVAQELRQAGYTDATENHESPLGTFQEHATSIYIRPGAQSFHTQDGATISFANGLVSGIAGDQNQPSPPTNSNRCSSPASQKMPTVPSGLVTYDEIPQNLVQAVLAIEDRRFFEHGGVNYYRLMMAMFKDVRPARRRRAAPH